MNERTYEMFIDRAYYDFYCVRDTANRDFNSRTSWHFMSKEDAEKFFELIQKAK